VENAAQQWTDQVNTDQCGKSAVTLTKMPNATNSENDVYISFSIKETDAVIAWAPNATDYSNIRTMRVSPEPVQSTLCCTQLQGAGNSQVYLAPVSAVGAYPCCDICMKDFPEVQRSR